MRFIDPPKEGKARFEGVNKSRNWVITTFRGRDSKSKVGGLKKNLLKFTIIFHRLKLCSLLFTHNCI